MKTKFYFFILPLLLLPFLGLSQTQVTIVLDSSGTDAYVNSQSGFTNTNYGTNQDLPCWSWTSGGNPTNARGYFKFDLSSIPQNAIIQSAQLSLYCNTTSGISQLHSGSNASTLSMVNAAWSENTITWANQPGITTTNQVSLPASTSSNQDYLNINILGMVTAWVSNPSANHGVRLALITESTFRSLIFASGDHPNASKRPRLVITYTINVPQDTIPNGCQLIRLNPISGKDALADSRTPNTNFGSINDFASWSWTFAGDPTIARSYIEFPFATLPQNHVVTSASLSLYCNTSSSITQLHSGVNASYLSRITGNWTEGSLTWNNKPTISLENRVVLNNSSSTSQNYPNINVTQLYQDAVNESQNKFGLALSLMQESGLKSMVFASSDHPDSLLRPKLLLCTSPAFANIIKPFTNDTLYTGLPYQIQYNTLINGKVVIEYSSDLASWTSITNIAASGNNSFTWFPNQVMNQCWIRIYSSLPPLVGDTINVPVRVLQGPTLSLVYPSPGKIYLQGSTDSITWQTSLTSGLRLEYKVGNNAWTVIDTNVNAANGKYSWLVPAVNSSEVRIRLVSRQYPTVSSETQGLVAIRPVPVISLSSPTGGEIWLNNGSRNIVWQATNSTKVNLDFSLNDTTWFVISDSVNNSGSFLWTLPGIHSHKVKIRVRDTYFPQYHAISQNYLSIINPPSITLLNPVANQVFFQGNVLPIIWTSNFSNQVRIQYSTNEGVNWETLVQNYPADSGKYLWTIPTNIQSSLMKIRVIDAGFPEFGGTLTGVFQILPKPVLSLTSPSGGEKWLNNQAKSITWSASNSQAIALEFKMGNGAWMNIQDSIVASSGTFNWQLPLIHSKEVWIKIKDRRFNEFADSLKVPISILFPPAIEVQNPNGGEVWYVGSNKRIEWNATYSEMIIIQFTKDNITWTNIVDSILASASGYDWIIPNTVTTNGRIRILDKFFPNYGDSSNASFIIAARPIINLTSPNGGENFPEGATRNITWSAIGADFINIDYSIQANSWTRVASNVNALQGTYSWLVPNSPSQMAKVRLSMASDSTIFDESDSVFIISFNIGLNSLEHAGIQIYPNPVKAGSIMKIDNLNAQDYLSIELFNAGGVRVLFNENVTNEIAIPDDLSKGIYLALFKDINGAYFYHKILVE